MDDVLLPGFSDVAAAAKRLAGRVRRTPVLTCGSLDSMAGARLFFKCENFQTTGSFKFRGATNTVLQFEQAEAARGVATHSSGNHGAALAAAAAARGIPAHVVMPTNSVATKRASVERYGGQVTECGPDLADREAVIAQVLTATGAQMVHPYNDARIITGQGTTALELLEETGPLDALVAPVGGGGLLSGACLVFNEKLPSSKIYGAEPAQADDARRSHEAGRLVTTTPDTIADGLRAQLGSLTFALIHRHAERIFTVQESSILQAMRHAWERLKIIIEPSSAVALAAVLDHAAHFKNHRVGVILTGGNVDLDNLPI